MSHINAKKHAELTKSMHEKFYNEFKANKDTMKIYGIMEYELIKSDDKPFNVEEMVFILFEEGGYLDSYSVEDLKHYLYFEFCIDYWVDIQLKELIEIGNQKLICEHLNNHYKDCGAHFDYQTKIYKHLLPNIIFQNQSSAFQYLNSNRESLSKYACVVSKKVKREDFSSYTFLDTNNKE